MVNCQYGCDMEDVSRVTIFLALFTFRAGPSRSRNRSFHYLLHLKISIFQLVDLFFRKALMRPVVELSC